MRTLFLSLSFVALISTAFAQEPQLQTQVPPARAFQLPPRTGIQTDLPLSLEDAIKLTLANNRDIELSRITQIQSDYARISAEGAYDPRVDSTASWQRAVTPVASALGGSATGAVENRNFTVAPGFTGLVPFYGGSFSADLTSQRSDGVR